MIVTPKASRKFASLVIVIINYPLYGRKKYDSNPKTQSILNLIGSTHSGRSQLVSISSETSQSLPILQNK